ncbi:amidohydrolase family protein [Solidesulfovibrio sp.]|uniref:amidohydrolase family protein n=1 Tax=Solidesulfovibrio sp. TaxID=2910990 RepID=UPI00260E592D|nr:amidohydrolase family protein [Solidesulfovibrio sp.]
MDALAAGQRAVTARRVLTMLPGAAPLDDAAVVLAGRRVLAVGPRRDVLRGFAGPVADHGDAVLVPGLVNAHGHLELAGLRGRASAPAGFSAWAAWLVAQDLSPPSPAVLARAVAEMAATGTGATIDVGSRAGAQVAAALAGAGLAGLVCHEAFGWKKTNRPAVPAALDAAAPPHGLLAAAASGHALYSTSPENLRRARDACRARGAPFCLHLAEHAEETELLATGAGPLAALLAGRVLPRGYVPPGRSPVAEAVAQGLLGPDVLAVHAVALDAADRRLLAASGAAVCLCPRSNARIGVGRADAPALLAAGVPLCLGTDSLASNDDLDLWNEVRALWAAFPDFPPNAVLEALTATPGRLLGRGLGRLAPGAAGGVAVVPPDLAERFYP